MEARRRQRGTGAPPGELAEGGGRRSEVVHAEAAEPRGGEWTESGGRRANERRAEELRKHRAGGRTGNTGGDGELRSPGKNSRMGLVSEWDRGLGFGESVGSYFYYNFAIFS